MKMAEDVMRQIEELRRRLDKAKIEAAKAEERAKRARADYEAVVKEIEAQGVTEDTLEAEIEKLEAELNAGVGKVRSALDDVEAMIRNGGKVDVGSTQAEISDLGF
jgi:chromosome segregation ATPase